MYRFSYVYLGSLIELEAAGAADLFCKVRMRNWSSPLQVASDAAGLESISQPGASDLLGVCGPVSGVS